MATDQPGLFDAEGMLFVGIDGIHRTAVQIDIFDALSERDTTEEK